MKYLSLFTSNSHYQLLLQRASYGEYTLYRTEITQPWQNEQYGIRLLDTQTINLGQDCQKIQTQIEENGVLKTITAFVVLDGQTIHISFEGRLVTFSLANPMVEERGHEQKNSLQSPMPGQVIKVFVKQNESVQAGSVLLIVEAMKMENEIKAPFAAKVSAIHVREKDKITSEDILLELEPI